MQILKMVHNIYHDHLFFALNKKNWKIHNFEFVKEAKYKNTHTQ